MDVAEPAGLYLSRRDRPLILYVIQLPDYSGGELMHVPVMEADCDPLLACPPGSRTEALARERGIPTVDLPFRSLRHSGGGAETLRSIGRGLRSARDLRRLMCANPEREVVYCTQLRPGMLAALATIGLDRRVIWHVPEFMPPAPIANAVRLLARLRCDRAIAHSHAVGSEFVGRSRQLRRRTVVVHPGTALHEAPSSDPVPGSARAPRAAVVGTVSRTKRTDLALDVADRVLVHEPSFELVVVGRAQFRAEDEVYERELQERVKHDERLRGHARFVGYTRDVAGELASVDMLLHARPDEPFGIALIEAMVAGLPVVAPRSAGPAEIVEPGVTGLLYEPGDADAAAAAVLELLADPERARAMGRAGRDRVRRLFTMDRQIAGIERVLRSCASP
jgi:glycosyltransferase involved in cell wall biosynthesis